MSSFNVAPSIEDIEAIVAEVLATLPHIYRVQVRDLRILVEDFPDKEIEEAMGLESPFELSGLYQGVPVGDRGVSHVAQDIDRIFLYRRPILDEWCETGEHLSDIVRNVLVHEIAHHLGLSDDDIYAIEAEGREEDSRSR